MASLSGASSTELSDRSDNEASDSSIAEFNFNLRRNSSVSPQQRGGSLEKSGRRVRSLDEAEEVETPQRGGSHKKQKKGHSSGTNNGRTSREKEETLKDVMFRMGKDLQEIKEQQQILQDKIEELSSKKTSKKTTTEPVSNRIVNLVHRGYDSGIKKGMMWTFERSSKCTDEENMQLTSHIREFVLGLVSDANESSIAVATSRYHKSKREAQTRNAERHKRRQLSYERKRHKAGHRHQACNAKKSYGPTKRAKVGAVLRQEYMSSEEEAEDGTFMIRPPNWQSDEFKKIKAELDAKYLTHIATPRAKQQTRRRQIGEASTKPPPKMIDPTHSWIYA